FYSAAEALSSTGQVFLGGRRHEPTSIPQARGCHGWCVRTWRRNADGWSFRLCAELGPAHRRPPRDDQCGGQYLRRLREGREARHDYGRTHPDQHRGPVAGHAFTTGQIPRLTDFERPPAVARLVAGAMDSACSSAHFGATKVEAKPGELVADTFQGEHATAYHVKDRGLVVITSCGHAGVINSVHQAQKASGVSKVHAIVGGFHLAPAPDEIVAKTVEAFRAIDPDYIIPMHCTGFNTIVAVHHAMPKKLVMPSTGTRVIFGA